MLINHTPSFPCSPYFISSASCGRRRYLLQQNASILNDRGRERVQTSFFLNDPCLNLSAQSPVLYASAETLTATSIATKFFSSFNSSIQVILSFPDSILLLLSLSIVS
jgi:hypothetical protein